MLLLVSLTTHKYFLLLAELVSSIQVIMGATALVEKRPKIYFDIGGR
jgi:hypothetical protein